MNNIIVGLGEILWDIFPNHRILGGAPANFAYHISQLGYDGYAISAIGNDVLGDGILENLDRKKLKYMIESVPFATGQVKVSVNNCGNPQYEITENVAWDNIPFSPAIEEIAQHTKAVTFGTLAQRNLISRTTINRFLMSMPKESIKVFDINLRQHFYSKSVIEDSLKISNVLKINDEELEILNQLLLIPDEREEVICKYLIDKYKLDIVILTKGSNGSMILTPNQSSILSTPKVQVVDTVGAGDAFTAAFVASYLQGNTIESAHQLAVETAACVCMQNGAMPQLPLSIINQLKR